MNVRRILAAATCACLLAVPTSAALAQDGPIVGTPPLDEAITGWGSTYLDPDYWAGYVGDAINDGHFNIPYPTDPVKPEAYLPNVLVADSDDYVSALPVEHVDLSQFTYEWVGEAKSIEQFLTSTRTDVVVLVKDGTVVGEWYRNGYGPDVRHQPWSVTKTFVAAVVGMAYHEGLIASLQDPIDAYITELAGTEWAGVTIEDLLQMESGVHWDEGTPVLAINTQVQQWYELALDLHTQGNLGMTRNEFLASLPPATYEPGEAFSYNSGNTQVLAWLTEVLYGDVFNQILSDKLWIPMGADGDAIMTADRVGAVVASHGLFARPYDFARFGEVMRNGGRTPEGAQVIPETWVDAMVTMTDVSGGAYGYQTWSARGAAADAFTASGFQGQKITVVPGTCLTGVRLSHALGGDFRDGDDPFDPGAYQFEVVTYSDQWESLLAQVGEALGPCAEAAGGGDPAPAPAPAPTDPSAMPATGAGHALLAVALLAIGVLSGSWRRPSGFVPARARTTR